MRLLEAMNVIYDMESIIVKVIFERTLKTCHIVSNITINCPKDPLQVSIKTPRIFTNKFHEGGKPMATCVVDFLGCTQQEPAQVNKPNLRDPNKK